MKKVITILFCFLTLFSYSQKSYIHGTIIMVAIVKDSIVMVADSRGAIRVLDPLNCAGAAGYIDSFPKIFEIKGYLIATAGEFMIGNKFVQQIVKDFNKKYPQKINLQETIMKFQSYLDSVYPTSIYTTSKKQQFIAAGFMRNKPQTITFNRNDLPAKISSFNSEGVNANEHKILAYIPKYKAERFDCRTVANVFEKCILDFAKDNNKEACIGGAISVAKMTSPSKITWVKNNFNNREYLNFNQFINDLKLEKITLTPLIKNGREIGIKYLETNPNYRP